jgi:GT2 family glycosyltransferase
MNNDEFTNDLADSAVVVLRLGPTGLQGSLLRELDRLRKCGASILVVQNHNGVNTGKHPDDPPWLAVSELDRNLGYAAAMNHGASTTSIATRLLFVTSDVDPDPGSFHELLRLVGLGKAGASGPVMVVDDEVRIGGTWNRPWGWARHAVCSTPLHKTRETGWLDGACLAVDAGTFRNLGGFEERTFLYCEDLLLCRQILQLSLPVLVAPVTIRQQSGMHRRSGAHGYLIIRNEIITARALGTKTWDRYVSASGRIFLELARSAKAQRSRTHHLKQAFGMAWALVDGFRHRAGPPPQLLLRWAVIPSTQRADSIANRIAF